MACTVPVRQQKDFLRAKRTARLLQNPPPLSPGLLKFISRITEIYLQEATYQIKTQCLWLRIGNG